MRFFSRFSADAVEIANPGFENGREGWTDHRLY
jgi:hypothetical protein